ncbi:hypothetical protein NL676_022901 [Syzygium grande]|nr:hypothetical protein NL676_022901 [Syzygium grande]
MKTKLVLDLPSPPKQAHPFVLLVPSASQSKPYHFFHLHIRGSRKLRSSPHRRSLPASPLDLLAALGRSSMHFESGLLPARCCVV